MKSINFWMKLAYWLDLQITITWDGKKERGYKD